MKWLTLVLTALLVMVQAELWLGDSGMRNRLALQADLAQQQARSKNCGNATPACRPRFPT